MSETLLRLVPPTLDQVRPNGPRPYYEALAAANFLPGWARLERPLWREPQRNFIPAIWRYAHARQALEKAGDYVPMGQTERRNMILVNPVDENCYGTTRNLVAAYQMIKPGEVALAHRHTPNALRLIIESEHNVFTTVNGTRFDMLPGDIVLTPNWHWHSHANEGARTAYWIDFLDVPLVQNLDGMFFDPTPDGHGAPSGFSPEPPLYLKSHEIVRRHQLPQQRSAASLPVAEGVMPTIGLTIEWVPAGVATLERRMMANNILAVISGNGTVFVDDEPLGPAISVGDVAAIPLWRRYRIEAEADLVLFRVSDAPVYSALGLFRCE